MDKLLLRYSSHPCREKRTSLDSTRDDILWGTIHVSAVIQVHIQSRSSRSVASSGVEMRCLSKSWIGSRFRESDICEGAARIKGITQSPTAVDYPGFERTAIDNKGIS